MNQADLDLLELTTLRTRLQFLNNRLTDQELTVEVYKAFEDERVSILDTLSELGALTDEQD